MDKLNKTEKKPIPPCEGDLVLQEIWRIKDELSAAREHDVQCLFTEARERQKHSGHQIVSFRKGKTTKRAA